MTSLVQTQEGLLGVIIKTHPSASDMSKCIKPVLVFWIAQVTTDAHFLLCLSLSSLPLPLSLLLPPLSPKYSLVLYC